MMPDRLNLAGSDFPDPWQILLPSRAYLLSVHEQTLPARRLAFDDAVAHFMKAADGPDPGVRDMALLGLIGDALQIVEDIGYFATAYSKPIPGIAHYVSATIFNDRTPNNFYSSLKNRTTEELKVIAGLWLQDASSGVMLPIHDALQLGDQLDGEDRAALLEAEDATVTLLRPFLLQLAYAWQQYRRYFHAFKHGGLIISRDDFQLIDDTGADEETSLQIWLTRGGEGSAWGDTELTPTEVADQVRRTGVLALDIYEYLLDVRLGSVELVEFGDDGSVQALRQPRSFWTFWFHEAQVSERTRDRLRERFGIALVEYHNGSASIEDHAALALQEPRANRSA
jgi:hypothetical protein